MAWWTKEETAFLFDNYKSLGLAGVAERLNRPYASIREKLLLEGKGIGQSVRCKKRARPAPVWTEDKVRLIESHQKLAYMYAKRHYYKCPSIPLEELQNEALMALKIAAAYHDDGKSNVKSFIPYACVSINKSLLTFRKERRKREKIDDKTFSDCQREKDDYDFVEQFIDRREGDPAVVAQRRMDAQIVMASLSPSARSVLSLRAEGATLDETGKELGVTKERVSQIEKRAVEAARRRFSSYEEG